MPDGSVRTCDSRLPYTSAVVVSDPSQGWRVAVFTRSAAEAREFAAQRRSRAPGSEYLVTDARVVVPLTLPQRRFLREIGEREMRLTSVTRIIALIKRGLVGRRRADRDAWIVWRTDVGTRVILDQDRLDAERAALSPRRRP